jgi:penicillin-binding protein 1A
VEAFRPGTEPGLTAFAGDEDCLSISGTCRPSASGSDEDGSDTADADLGDVF